MVWKIIDKGGEYEIDLDEFDKAIAQILQKAGNVLRTALATPPKKRPGEKHLAGPLPGGFYTRRQRSFVMSSLRSGVMKVPYLRTGNLPRSWSISEPEKKNNDVAVFVFSDVSEAQYNEWVQQDDEQARRKQVLMHQDWPTPNEVANKHERKIEKMLLDEMKNWGAA